MYNIGKQDFSKIRRKNILKMKCFFIPGKELNVTLGRMLQKNVLDKKKKQTNEKYT